MSTRLLAVLVPALAYAQPASQQALAKAAMSQSIAAQRLSVSRQKAAMQTVPQPSRTIVHDFDLSGDFDCARMDGAVLASDLQSAAADNKLPQNLVEAVIETESAFHPCAVSSRGALGLMQLMPETAASMGLAEPFDAKANVLAGSKYLGMLLSKYSGDISLALAAYNAGSGAVDRYSGIPPFPETRDYVQKVMALWNGVRRPTLPETAPASGASAAPFAPIPSPAFNAPSAIDRPETVVSCFGGDSERCSQ